MSYGEGPLDYARERWEADCDLPRLGRGKESRPGAEDVPTRGEVADDA